MENNDILALNLVRHFDYGALPFDDLMKFPDLPPGGPDAAVSSRKSKTTYFVVGNNVYKINDK